MKQRNIEQIKKDQQNHYHRVMRNGSEGEKRALSSQSGFAAFARNRRKNIIIHYPG
ncbi:MAG: hypothetical protein AAGC78_06430 [Cellvibrio sp.]|uniref:hypothetical protein n=1 Tax=Cellvibrio sp. TaxID=1965322 RepID=UPI0031A462F5